jgi:hypothetical protein
MIFVGITFSFAIGVFVDKTEMFEETMKILMGLAALFSSAIIILLELHPNRTLILAAIIGFGACSIASYPLGMELGVETTYPIPEAISTGMLLFSGYSLLEYV